MLFHWILRRLFIVITKYQLRLSVSLNSRKCDSELAHNITEKLCHQAECFPYTCERIHLSLCAIEHWSRESVWLFCKNLSSLRFGVICHVSSKRTLKDFVRASFIWHCEHFPNHHKRRMQLGFDSWHPSSQPSKLNNCVKFCCNNLNLCILTIGRLCLNTLQCRMIVEELLNDITFSKRDWQGCKLESISPPISTTFFYPNWTCV